MLKKGRLKIHYETFPHLKKGMYSDSMQNSRIIIIIIVYSRRAQRTSNETQANNAIFVHRINLSRIYKSYASFAGFLACVQTSPVFVPRATKKEVGTRKFHTNNARFGVNETALLILFSDNCCWFFF